MTSPDAAAKKAVINELSALAQSVWFTLLGALAFLGIVLLSSTDADFLLNSSETELPLVKISVPTERFFFLAPIVTTALYLYLHFYCLKLWARFCEIEPQDLEPQDPKSDVRPTLINDLALHLIPDAKPRGGVDWAWVSGLATMLLIWVFHPALLVAVIYRSGAASGGWDLLSVRGMALACLLVSAAVGLLSFTAALGIRYKPLADRKGIVSIFLLLLFIGSLATYSGWPRLTASLPEINLDRANLAGVGPDWPLAAERREAFRVEWCNREETDIEICGLLAPHDVAERARIANLQRAYCLQRNIRVPTGCRQTFDRLDAGFAADWSFKRRSELGRLPELDLTGRDLAHASAQGARLINARLEKARLEAARLAQAQVEGANLISAHLEDAQAFYASFDRANLTGAFLSRADLVSSSLEGATLLRATLTTADLTEAQLADADLGEAVLTGANLTRASLRRADLREAVLVGAILDGADLSGARHLTQDQLADAVGDKDTILPAGWRSSRLQIRDCWPRLPAKVATLLATGTLPADIGEALKAHLCAKGQKPQTFPRAALPYPTRVDPGAANARYLEDRAAERASVARYLPPPQARVAASELRPRARPLAAEPVRLAGR